MNLSLQAARSLPLAAALISGEEVVASTPEWRGESLGCVTYVARGARLVVDTGAGGTESTPVLAMLFDALDGSAAAMSGDRAGRVHVLAASLRVLAGRTRASRGSVDHVVALLRSAAAARSEVRVDVGEVQSFTVDDPAVVALIALQVVANAERHDRTRAVRIDAAAGVIRLSWVGAGGATVTARRRSDRTRWGLGFARIAADSVGAVVGTPLVVADGEVTLTIDLGVRQLALPVAAVREGRVRTSTAAWDEETGLGPGTEATPNQRVASLCATAESTPGEIIVVDGWSARYTTADTWLAVPPDGIAARVSDVLDGLVHERALWDGIPLALRARVVALAALAGAGIGTPLPRVTAMSWNAAAATVAAAVGFRGDVPEVTGVGAVDPQVVLSLAVALDGTVEARDDTLLLHVPADRCRDPLLAPLQPLGDPATLAL